MQWVMGKNQDLLFLKSKKAIFGKKNIFRSYSIIRNLKKSRNPWISQKTEISVLNIIQYAYVLRNMW